MTDDRFGVNQAIADRSAQFAANVAAVNRLAAIIMGLKPRPLTRREKLMAPLYECRWRIHAAWHVLRTGEHLDV